MRKRPRPAAGRPSARRMRLPGTWLSHHLQGALGSLGRLLYSPLPTAMTVAVVAIALALPAGLYVLTRNLNDLGESWDQSPDISLFLELKTDIEQARRLAAKLRAHPDLDRVTLISPQEALAELGRHGLFRQAIAQLEENPLPAVLALQPASHLSAPAALERLARELEALPQADFARLDTQWIRRFQAILQLAQQGVSLLGGTLALAVLLVVGNTIRLEIQNRRDEIEIMELVGATPAFVRRPFLYTGSWYGLFGGLGAWLLVTLAVLLLQEPVSRLAALYQTRFPLSGLGAGGLLAMLGAGLGLGLLGSWVSVARHLQATEPR